MRPIGGWFFGRLADRHGRKHSLMVSVFMMCGGSLMIALLPTHSQIGVAAPVLLLVARLVQGLSVGGEYASGATYMSEIATRGRRGFYSSFQYVTIIAGQLLVIALLVLLHTLLSQSRVGELGLAHSFRRWRLGRARRSPPASVDARDCLSSGHAA